MSKVNFKPEFWELISSITPICEDVCIQKTDDNSNIISMSNNVIGAILEMSSEMFDYSDELIIPNFPEFSQIQKILGETHSMDIDDNQLVILNAGEMEVKYLTGTDDMIAEGVRGPRGFDYGEEGAAYILPVEVLKDIKALTKLLIEDNSKSESAIASKASVTVDGDKITVMFKNTGGTLDGNHSGHSFIRTFDNIIENNNDGPYTYEVEPLFFSTLPSKADYRVSLKPKGNPMTIMRATAQFNDEEGNKLADSLFYVGVFR